MPSDNDYRVEYEDQQYDDYSLENILAEYKGNAFIDGDKKTPSDILNEKTERIVLEVTGDNRAEAEFAVPENDYSPVKIEASGDDTGSDVLSEVLSDTAADEAQYADKDAAADDVNSDTATFKKVRKHSRSGENDGDMSETKVFRVPLGKASDNKKPGLISRFKNRRKKPAAVDAEEPEVLAENAEIEDKPVETADIAYEPVETASEKIIPEKSPVEETATEVTADVSAEDIDDPIFRTVDLKLEYELDPSLNDTYSFDSEKEASDVSKETDEVQTEEFRRSGRENKKRFSVIGVKKKLNKAKRTAPKEPKLIVDPVYEEPNLRDAGKKFAAQCNSVAVKSFIAFAISTASAVLTFIFEARVDEGLEAGSEFATFCGLLLIMQLLVMALSVRVIVRGITDIFRLRPGAESLLVISCIVTAISAAFSVAFPEKVTFIPYCTVSAFACAFFLWGEKLHLSGITESLRAAVNSSVPVGVTTEYSERIDRVIVKKIPGFTAGFYNNLIAPDISENIFRIYSPIIAAISIVLAFAVSLKRGDGSAFFHIFAAILAGGTSFFTLLCFALPFSSVSRKLRPLGAAIAGWGGADDIYYSDGACVRDEDIFPTGTIKLAGMKLYENETPEKAIRYAASIVIASGSGLSKLFSGLLSQHGLSLAGVEGFEFGEGGNSGYVNGDRVLVGSSAFINLMGIRVPDSMCVPNSVYTAVNNKLIAVFNIEYMPVNSVQSALLALIGAKIKIFFAAKDFNLTPLMLEKKFKTQVEDVEYIPVQESYGISDEDEGGSGADAILSREGLGPFGMAASSGKRLRIITIVTTGVTVFASILGVVLMFALCWTGSFAAACAGNLLLFMIISLIIEALIAFVLKFIK